MLLFSDGSICPKHNVVNFFLDTASASICQNLLFTLLELVKKKTNIRNPSQNTKAIMVVAEVESYPYIGLQQNFSSYLSLWQIIWKY